MGLMRYGQAAPRCLRRLNPRADDLFLCRYVCSDVTDPTGNSSNGSKARGGIARSGATPASLVTAGQDDGECRRASHADWSGATAGRVLLTWSLRCAALLLCRSDDDGM